MGSGLSSNHRGIRSSFHQPAPAAPPPAWVIGADGSLREFPASSIPSSFISVSDVLGGSDNADRFFVCSSDALYFDAEVPALGADELLRPGQIYFVLPAAMLGRPLSAADMAALAVRATEAMAARAPRPRGGIVRGLGMKKVRVVPARAASVCGDGEVNEKLNQRTLGGFETAAARSPARNAKNKKSAVLARPTMKRVLSAIQEVAE
ncbi:hypothetical protein QOZ80_6BG0498900 [Eleusine coracana subsp. coracana]|nr:hypothetical protein QOZ80_6BG0498900 [Eleusine coracana subsp. coracana]